MPRGAEHAGRREKAAYVTVSENATFLATDPDAGPSILRVHRLGYHTEAAIASELAWMDALRAEAGVRTPRALPARDGRRVVSVPERGGPAPAVRHCVRVHRCQLRPGRPVSIAEGSVTCSHPSPGVQVAAAAPGGRPGSPSRDDGLMLV
jgi:hypothetical protein